MSEPIQIMSTRVAPAIMEMIKCDLETFAVTRATAICGGA